MFLSRRAVTDCTGRFTVHIFAQHTVCYRHPRHYPVPHGGLGEQLPSTNLAST